MEAMLGSQDSLTSGQQLDIAPLESKKSRMTDMLIDGTIIKRVYGEKHRKTQRIKENTGEKMFTDKERNLANEANLTASLLGNGLNALRKADLYHKGLYYQAFFSLSIGIERLLKIIIINEYRVNLIGFLNDFAKRSNNISNKEELANIIDSISFVKFCSICI